MVVLVALMATSCMAQPFIPFRCGDRWGLADTNQNMVVLPSYDFAIQYDEFPDSLFIFRQNELYGLRSVHRVIIPPKLEVPSVDENRNLLVDARRVGPGVGDRRYLYYTWEGELLFSEGDTVWNLETIDLKKRLRMVEYTDGRTEFLILDLVNQKIVQHVAVFDGHVFHFNIPNGVQLLRMADSTYQTIDLIYQPGPDSFQVVYQPVSNLRPVPRIPTYEHRSNLGSLDAFDETLEIYHVKEEVEEFSIRDDSVYYRNDPYTWRGVAANKQPVPLPSGTVRVRSFIKFQNSNQGIEPGRVLPSDSGTYRDAYIEIQSGKKVGAINRYGNLPGRYNAIQGLRFGPDWSDYIFIVQQRGRFGVVDGQGRIMVPVEYSNIRPVDQHVYEVTKNNHVGIYDVRNHRGLVVECLYDSVWYHPQAIRFQLGQKYGYYKSEVIQTPPIFDYPVRGIRTFRGYQLFELENSNGELMGYGRKDGVVYYSEE